ncbi:MAG: hypothetical protein J5855_02045 [Mailhella sp.]|nr:hypothetical protein [Mailhella sp.]
MLLFINSLAHFCTDGLCAAVLFSLAEPGAWMFMLYTTLAFSTQCLAGLAADRVDRQCLPAAASMLLVLTGWLLPLPPEAAVCLIGLGNSGFHVAGGVMTLRGSRGKARDLGLFVAPGAMGLALGMLWPRLGIAFAAGLLFCSLAVIPAEPASPAYSPDAEKQKSSGIPLLIPILLAMAVAVRAVGGTAAAFPWKNGTPLILLTVLCVAAGKAAGGYVCDHMGAVKAAAVSIVPAAVLTVFYSEWALPSLAGQFAMNISMPVTLWLLYKCMPDSPGFAFGLAASALWPGTLAGRLMQLAGPALGTCVAASFLFGLWAILHAAHVIDEHERANDPAPAFDPQPPRIIP